MKAALFFSPEIQAEIVKTIKQAEKNTSGEIRLFIEDLCKHDVLDRAAFMFEKMKMHKTKERNGVLFYLAMNDKKFAIIGDAGIHSKVGEKFWDEIKEKMKEKFSGGELVEGLCSGIQEAGDALGKHFPHNKNDKNELSDNVVLG